MSQQATAQPDKLTTELLDSWANDPNGPVALHLKQRLLAVEGVDGEEQILYPPTYANIGYNIDRLADGTRVALIDSVGSQANRIEPLFKSGSGDLAELVPQIEIVLRKEACGTCDACKRTKKPNGDKCEKPWKEKRSLFELAHRAADAVVQSCPTLLPKVEEAFSTLRKTGDASLLCTIAPTSLVFGCWDSRGGSGEKRPRLVRAIIRAWDVDELHTAAQFNSVWKALSEEQQSVLAREANAKKKKLSVTGFADAPAVTYKDGRRVLGGIVARGPIQRDVTINLVALRGLNGGEKTEAMRKYLLALSILSGTGDIDLFLREGCNLKYAHDADEWYLVPRRGEDVQVDLASDEAHTFLREYAHEHYKPFKEAWDALKLGVEHEFDLKAATQLLGKTPDEEEGA
ncbi:type I-U CRISPR-associated RAMP protein Csb1/Cas7u [Maioricimonas sp. JC845]|uniref:type I-G CRISPR-associated RAMP protein Csb1/Cas7g n=1 Tax=Maioricimonas sp. JC845 TaxID=3232138 RepID=UPI0034596BF1